MRAARPVRLAGLALGVGLALAAGAAGATEAETPVRPPVATSASPSALRVYLVRHAQAWKNVPALRRPPGMSEEQLDSLTEKGQEQARAIGRRLRGAGITRVVSSPAQRARQTAEAIAGELGIGPVEVSEAFQPLQHGTSRQAADFRWRTGHWKAGRDPRPEGGESLADGLARAAADLDARAAAAPGTAIVVVTHGEITAALRSRAAGISPLAGHESNFVPEATVSEVAITPHRWQLLSK
jgi:probable phosphoglycerate mutase